MTNGAQDQDGRSPSGPGSQASPEAASASSPPVSIPSAERRGKPFIIDTTPTWAAVLPIYLAAATEGALEGRQNALSELRRMAGLADRYAAHTPALCNALRTLVQIIEIGVTVDMSDADLRTAHPDDRRFIKRTRKALAAARAALRSANPEPVATA